MYRKLWKGLTLSLGLVLALGCSNRMDEPEKVDPIYQDLIVQLNTLNLKIEKEKKKIETFKKLKKGEIGTVNEKDVRMARKLLRKYDQEQKYIKIRQIKRKAYVRKQYQQALEQGREWPDPTLLQNYTRYKRLKNAPQNWDARVPKLKDRYSRSPSSVAKPGEGTQTD